MTAIYECIGKGRRYSVLTTTTGAGTSRGESLVIYQCVEDGECYHRTIEDFSERMRLIEDAGAKEP